MRGLTFEYWYISPCWKTKEKAQLSLQMQKMRLTKSNIYFCLNSHRRNPQADEGNLLKTVAKLILSGGWLNLPRLGIIQEYLLFIQHGTGERSATFAISERSPNAWAAWRMSWMIVGPKVMKARQPVAEVDLIVDLSCEGREGWPVCLFSPKKKCSVYRKHLIFICKKGKNQISQYLGVPAVVQWVKNLMQWFNLLWRHGFHPLPSIVG